MGMERRERRKVDATKADLGKTCQCRKAVQHEATRMDRDRSEGPRESHEDNIHPDGTRSGPKTPGYRLRSAPSLARVGLVLPLDGEPPTGEPDAGDPPVRFGGGRSRGPNRLLLPR